MVRNLKEAVEAARTQDIIKTDVKGFIKIKRELNNLSRTRPQLYTETPDEDKWLWHEAKAARRYQKIYIMGKQLVCIDR